MKYISFHGNNRKWEKFLEVIYVEVKVCRLNMAKEYFTLRDRIIEEDFKNLDENQKKAVLNNDRNVLILACPGSGKTTVLINKVLYLVKYGNIYGERFVPNNLSSLDLEILESYIKKENLNENEIHRLNEILFYRRVNPDNIAVITFTKSAALNMKKRFEYISKSSLAPFFGTFHGLFYKILIKHYGREDIIESSESYRVLSNVLVKHLDEVSEDKITELKNNISLFKCSGVSIEDFNPNIDRDIFIKAYNTYENYKKERNILDFDDLQIKCQELFLESPKVLEFYRRGFKYLLIDEFQDCDSVQINIMKLLNEYNSLFAVGDEDQCIYNFRGSRPDYMLDFDKNFKQGIKLYLSTNYRSTSNIVKISSNLIKNNVMRNKKEMIPYKKDKKSIEVLNYSGESSQSEDISLNIEKLKSLGKYSYKDCTVLYRTNIESRSLIDTFIRKKIPFKLLDKQYNFFNHFICKDLIAYLKLSIFSDDTESFRRIINKPFRYVSKISIEKVKESHVKDNCFELLKNMDSTPIFQIKSIEKVQKDVARLNKMSLSSAVEFIITDLNYHDYIKEYSRKFKIDIKDLENILEEFKEATGTYKSIITFLAHIDAVKEELNKNNDKRINEDSVTLSTIHKVKGMEYKNVFVINCTEETIPHISNIDKNLEEERRLFYVAITRAIDNLFICVPKYIRGKHKEISRFVEECEINSPLNFKEIYKEGEEVVHSTFGKGKVVYIDNKVIEIGFSNNINRKFDIKLLHNRGIIRKL